MTPQARALRQALEALSNTADAAALSGLRSRHPGVDPDLVGALATQVRLQRRGRDRLGPWADDMVLEEEALQQSTRRDVAIYRADRLAQRLADGRAVAGLTVADIGSGLGVDARALAQAGLRVVAIERDPWRAEAAQINLAGYPDRVQVMQGDVLALDAGILDGCDAAYVDPARRAHAGPRRIDAGRSLATPDPRQWSPPWPWVLALSERMPVVAKVAPGFDPRQAPAGADIEWIDHGGETVEASIWLGAWGRGMRRATAVLADRPDRGGSADSPGCAEWLEAPAADTGRPGPATTQARRLLLEPTPGVARARLVADLAERLGAERVDGGGWLTADEAPDTALARAWRVLEEVPYAARELRAWLRGRGSATWKTADAEMSAVEWDRRVGHRAGGGAPITIVITGQGRAYAVERAIA